MNEYKSYEDEIMKIFELDQILFERRDNLNLYFIATKGNKQLRFRLVEAGNRLYQKMNGDWYFEGRIINGKLIK